MNRRRFQLAFLLCWLIGHGLAAPARSQSRQAQDYFDRGVRLQQRGELQPAREAYEAALRLAPGRVDALSNLGLVFARLGEHDRAAATFLQALELSPELHLVRHFRGLSLLKLNRLKEGIAELEVVCAAQPENLAAAYTLGSAYLTDGQLDQAGALIDRAFGTLDSAEAHLIKGAFHLATADYRAALATLLRAKELNPKLPGLRSQLGYAQAYLGNRTEAAAEFEAELKDNPLDFNANACLGWLYRSDGRLDEAGELLRRALGLQPENSSVLFQLALLAQARRQTQEATRLLEGIVKLKPDFTAAHVLLARLYYQAKRLDDARREREIIDRLNAEEQSRYPSAQDRHGRYGGTAAPPK